MQAMHSEAPILSCADYLKLRTTQIPFSKLLEIMLFHTGHQSARKVEMANVAIVLDVDAPRAKRKAAAPKQAMWIKLDLEGTNTHGLSGR